MKTETKLGFKALAGSCKTIHDLNQKNDSARNINIPRHDLRVLSKQTMDSLDKGKKNDGLSDKDPRPSYVGAYAEQLIEDLKNE